jgi:hypothetical protein
MKYFFYRNTDGRVTKILTVAPTPADLATYGNLYIESETIPKKTDVEAKITRLHVNLTTLALEWLYFDDPDYIEIDDILTDDIEDVGNLSSAIKSKINKVKFNIAYKQQKLKEEEQSINNIRNEFSTVTTTMTDKELVKSWHQKGKMTNNLWDSVIVLGWVTQAEKTEIINS